MIQTNVSLEALNTLAIPATAQSLVWLREANDLFYLKNLLKQHPQPVTVLGEGSNVVFASNPSSLVVVNRLRGIELLDEDDISVHVRVGAGENWHTFLLQCLSNGWHGLENLALIPGTVGAAPIQNIGAYGVEVGECIARVEAIDLETFELLSLSRDDCEFGYRDSLFKRGLAGKVLITSVEFTLSKSFSAVLSYPSLAQALESCEAVSAKTVFDTVCRLRSSKLPDPAVIPNAGSFFKNPIISHEQLAALREHYPEIVFFPAGDRVKLAAAWLIERAGFKTAPHKGVTVHAQQALVLINPEHRSGAEVLAFAESIKAEIKRLFNVELDIEPTLIGAI